MEGLIFSDVVEDFSTKIEYVLTSIFFTLLALFYPTYKGLAIIRNWEALEKVLVDQGMKFNEKGKSDVPSLDSINSALMNELTRRKNAEERVASERQNFFNMLDQLPVCFHLQANDYSIPFANKMFRERFGSPDNKKCYQVMHNRSKACDPCSTFGIFDSLKTESSPWISPDKKNYMTVATPFKDFDGTTLIMEMAIDITSEQTIKGELRQVLDEQEKRIKERTLDLERSNNLLQEFSYFAAHDLKEPLRKIMIFSDRVREDMRAVLGGADHRYLDGIHGAAERMNFLIDDLLHLSQVSAQTVIFGEVNLNDIVDEVIGDLEPSYPGSRDNVNVQSLPSIKADKTQMYQLFKNLLSNSLKYAKTEEPLKVLIEAESAGDGQCLILFKDNGIGFDDKYKSKIFKPFERLHGRNEYSGTGVGLAICKKVVELHDGELNVHSELNVGTTFTIHLPISGNSS